MTFKHIAFALASILSTATHAASGTANGSILLPYFPTYELQYQADWESNEATFTFVPSISATPSSLGFQFSGFFTTSTPQVAGPADITTSAQIRIINTATGIEELPLVWRSATTYLNGSSSFGASGFAGGFRYSFPLLETSSSVTGPGGLPGPYIGATALDFLSTVHFVPGNFLNPSPDPACASIACMIPGSDSLSIFSAGNVSYSVSVVPEPASTALIALGLALVALARKRSVLRTDATQ